MRYRDKRVGVFVRFSCAASACATVIRLVADGRIDLERRHENRQDHN
jgi:hypothetical protein